MSNVCCALSDGWCLLAVVNCRVFVVVGVCYLVSFVVVVCFVLLSLSIVCCVLLVGCYVLVVYWLLFVMDC